MLRQRSTRSRGRSILSLSPRLELLEARRILAVVSADIDVDTTWTLAESPYEVTRDVDVDPGATLTIEPGVTVQFRADARLEIQGRIVAEGLPNKRISFERVPGQGAWDGLKFENTLEDNRITYTDMVGGDAQGEAIDMDDSRLLLDHVTWTDVDATILELSHPSLIVRNSHFPATSGSEIIHGSQISGDEYLVIQGNVFENGNNGGDVIDFLGAEHPGPVLQILDNVFMGGGDDGLDLDGTDAHIEGNLFMNFRKNTGRNTTSNAIATGLPQNGDDNRTEITVVRNIFINNDHAILLKEEAFATVENNVFIDTVEAVVQFNEVGGTSVRGVGKGANFRNNIFSNNAQLFKNLVDEPEFTTLLTVEGNLIPNDRFDFGESERNIYEFGEGNFDASPMFVSPETYDFSLQDDSPARNRGFGGSDLGAYVAAGGRIEVISQQAESAELQVAGPGVTHYRYRVDDGALSDLRPASETISIDNLDEDTQVEVVTMNSAGEWHVAETAAFRQATYEVITPQRTRLGESLPTIVRRLNYLGDVDTLASETVSWSGGGTAEEITILKGIGVLSEPVTEPLSFIPTVAGSMSTEVQLIGDQFPIVEVGTTLSSDQTWTADKEYRIASDFTVLDGATLTIEPGTRVLLGNDVNLFVGGTLHSNGTSTNPILFNSFDESRAWGGIEVRGNGSADFAYTFFTQGGGDVSREFGHSDSQPVLRATTTQVNCDACFVIDNEGKGFGATNGFVNIHNSVVSLNDTGGEFSRSVANIENTWVLNIPTDVRDTFADDDNDGFYFAGAHSSGEASRFANSYVINTKDDGLDHNGARLEIESAWIQGGFHEGLAASNTNWARVHDSVFTGNNQGVEAGYESPDVTVTQSVIVGNRNTIDPDSPITAGLRFGDGYSNRSYSGHITASHLVIHDNGDNVRNWDNRAGAEQAGVIDLTNSLANDDDFADNASGIPVFSQSMHLLRGSAGFADGPEGMPLGRVVPALTWTPSAISLPGDFDQDGSADLSDLHELCGGFLAAQDGEVDVRFDLNGDGELDEADRDMMVLEILNLTYGDSNLDGRFTSADFVEIFAAGLYEDAIAGNAEWTTGDWNCDREFDTRDMVLAFQQGTYTNEARQADLGERSERPGELREIAAALAADSYFADNAGSERQDRDTVVPDQDAKRGRIDAAFVA